MKEKITNAWTEFLPIVPFIGNHPKMIVNMPERDRRFDVITQSEYSQNTEAYD